MGFSIETHEFLAEVVATKFPVKRRYFVRYHRSHDLARLRNSICRNSATEFFVYLDQVYLIHDQPALFLGQSITEFFQFLDDQFFERCLPDYYYPAGNTSNKVQ